MAPEQTGAEIQNDWAWNLATESKEVRWGGRPGKGSRGGTSRGILNGEGSPGKERDLLRDPLRDI